MVQFYGSHYHIRLTQTCSKDMISSEYTYYVYDLKNRLWYNTQILVTNFTLDMKCVCGFYLHLRITPFICIKSLLLYLKRKKRGGIMGDVLWQLGDSFFKSQLAL